MVVLATFLIAANALVSGTACAEACENVDAWKQRGKLIVGFRTHAPPFSYSLPEEGDDTRNRPVRRGYSVDICSRIVEAIRERAMGDQEREDSDDENVQRGPGITIEWRGVQSHNRLDFLRSGKIDLLCGTTSVSLERLREFESSLFIFLTGASFVCTRESHARNVADMAGKRIGFLKRSTTEAVVDRLLLEAEVNPAAFKVEKLSYKDAVASLKSEEVDDPEKLDCFFGDRDVLAHYVATEWQESSRPFLSKTYFSLEPYGVFMRRQNPELAYLVNTELVKMFEADPKSQESIHFIFRRHFPNAQMSDYLRMLFQVQRLPAK